MAKDSGRLRERSYAAYIKNRAEWAEKGYGLDRQLTQSEYASAYADARHAGWKNIARTIASQDRTFGANAARGVLNRLKSAGDYEDVDHQALKALQTKYKSAKDIQSLSLTEEEVEMHQAVHRQRLVDRGKNPDENIYQATARVILFNELRDAGLSYKEAEKVVYG